MIAYFAKSETDFTHNGLGVLDNYIISPAVTEELNGIYKLEFDYPIHAPHADGLLLERIVRCPVPNSSGNSSGGSNSGVSGDTNDTNYQLFRIAEREASISGLLHIVAYHIFYDLARNLIEDTYIIMKTGEQALGQILAATQYSHPFTSGSDIMETANARLVRKNPAEVMNDSRLDNGFLSRWGGEIVRDNFHINMCKVRGSDNGVSIRDKKNLTGYRADVDFSTVVTRIMPEGFNGLFLPEKYVDSPRIGEYNAPMIKVIKYDRVKAAVGEQAKDADAVPLADAYAALRTLAAKEYTENHIDRPNATYQVEFAPLERTEEYRNFAVLESISLGDTVSVIHESDGLDITARMVSYRYNPLTKAYISVTLGNYSPRFTDVAKEIKRMEDGVSQAVSDANAALTSANGKNTNYYGPDTPKSPRIGDLWFRENGEITELWIYEVRDGATQWFPLSLDLVDEQIRQELEAALAEVDAAKASAANALAAGQNAQNTADQSARDADDALNKANQAVNNALAALSGASTATTIASDAYNKSVKSTAVAYAVSSSGTAPPVSGWQTTIPATSPGQFLWTRTIITLQDDSAITSYGVSKHGDVGPPGEGQPGPPGTDAPVITMIREQYYLSASNTAQTGGSWSDAVPTWATGKFYWTRVAATYNNGTTTYSAPVLADALNNSLVTALEAKTTAQTLETTVSQHASAISLNATNVANLNDRVTTSEASITVQAGLIAGKASQTTVDTLTRRVTTAESTIIQQAEMINLRVSKNDIINQINISTEGILIGGDKVHITGQTTIDNAVIQTAMIKDAAITNAKIANLDAAKITTGSLSADRIASGSITSDKLTIANGFIVNAMIADATISGAKIVTLDAGKITTGTLSADRIAANSISSSKLVVADGFINTAMIANASITTAKIADLTVGTAKIADAAITDAKIANLSANKITTGTLDASAISVTNINASNITTGTLNCSKFNVTNLSASSISSGTLNASNVTITNLNASNITSGTLDASKITVTNININNVKYGDWPVITCTGTYGNPNIEFGNRQNSSSGYVNTLSIYGMTLTIGGRNISIGDTSAGSTVSITAASTISLMYSSSTYIQFNGYNKEFRPSGTGFYLGTSSYPWNYGYFTELHATSFSPTSVTAQYITINGSSSTSSIYNSTVNIGNSSYYVVFNSTQVRPCSSGMYLGTSSYPWNYGYFTELHATTFSPTSVSAQYITINGSSSTSSIYNSTVNIGTSSYYVVFSSTSVRPSTSGMYLGTSSYPWTYSYIANLYTTTSAQLGNSTSSRVGFFGSSGTTRQTVASVSTSGTLANAITGVNAIITALKSYGLIG